MSQGWEVRFHGPACHALAGVRLAAPVDDLMAGPALTGGGGGAIIGVILTVVQPGRGPGAGAEA